MGVRVSVRVHACGMCACGCDVGGWAGVGGPERVRSGRRVDQ